MTTVHSNGIATKSNIGDRLDEDDVQRSMEEEHNRLSRRAREDADRYGAARRKIESVTEAGRNIVVIYDDGGVEIHHWLREEEE